MFKCRLSLGMEPNLSKVGTRHRFGWLSPFLCRFLTFSCLVFLFVVVVVVVLFPPCRILLVFSWVPCMGARLFEQHCRELHFDVRFVLTCEIEWNFRVRLWETSAIVVVASIYFFSSYAFVILNTCFDGFFLVVVLYFSLGTCNLGFFARLLKILNTRFRYSDLLCPNEE